MVDVFLSSILTSLSDYAATSKLYLGTHAGWLAPIALSAFTLINALRIFAYLPQIRKVARDTGGAAAVSTVTWGLFLLSHLTTVVYAVACIGDWLMAMLFFGNAVACAAIVGLTLVKRRRHAVRVAGDREDNHEPVKPVFADR